MADAVLRLPNELYYQASTPGWTWEKWYEHRKDTHLPRLVIEESIPDFLAHLDWYFTARDAPGWDLGSSILSDLENGIPIVARWQGDVRSGKTHAAMGLALLIDRIWRGLPSEVKDVFTYDYASIWERVYDIENGKPRILGEVEVVDEEQSTVDTSGHHDEDLRKRFRTMLTVRGISYTSLFFTSISRAGAEDLKESCQYLFRKKARGQFEWKRYYDDDRHRSPRIKSKHILMKFPPLCRELAQQVYAIEAPAKAKLVHTALTLYREQQTKEKEKLAALEKIQKALESHSSLSSPSAPMLGGIETISK